LYQFEIITCSSSYTVYFWSYQK